MIRIGLHQSLTHTRLAMAGAFAIALAALLAGCPAAPHAAPPKSLTAAGTEEPDIRWRLHSPRNQTSYLKLELPVIISGTKITIDDPLLMDDNPAAVEPASQPDTQPAATQPDTQPADAPGHRVSWDADSLQLFSSHIAKGYIEGPLVDQLLGQGRTPTDAGSYLTPLPRQALPDASLFEIKEPLPLYLRIKVPAGQDPGEYRFRIHMEVPGKPSEDAFLALNVSDLAVPTVPRVLGIMTTTLDRLAKLYPEAFADFGGNILDRANPDHRAAVEALDSLVKAARDEGMALYVEDMTPAIKVDETGMLIVDWDAYDRVMQPYMDGSLFADRVPQPVWLAPLPPRRIRESATQLWQYMDACAKHFADKGWIATPAFLHPALAQRTFGETPEAAALRIQVGDMMRLHMPRDMLVAASPDAISANIPHAQLWIVQDGDPRLPPAGPLATEPSVRTWPWVCVARGSAAIPSPAGAPASSAGVRGFVWRDAIASSTPAAIPVPMQDAAEEPAKPLLIVASKPAANAPAEILPSLRMVWLSEGLGDAALLGLLEKRSDPLLVRDVLAGIVGRTGFTNFTSPTTLPGADLTPPPFPERPPGFLYAAWPTDKDLWQQVTPMLEKLVLANDPGQRISVKPDDPLYLAAKLWLAEARRPIARVTGYDLGVHPGREGDILDARIGLLAENPADAAAEFELRFLDLPGDFELAPNLNDNPDGIRRRTMQLKSTGISRILLPLAGHLETLQKNPDFQRVELTETHAGASTRLPVAFPIYRMHATDTPPKLDGKGDDWPMDNELRVFGEMTAGIRYLSRPDLLTGTVRQDAAPAVIRWSFDHDYLYMLARCPQESVSEDRNSEWPVTDGRWWGSDGLQVQLSELVTDAQRAKLSAATTQPATLPAANPDAARSVDLPRIIQIAFKPTGVLLLRTGRIVRPANTTGETQVEWTDGPPPIPSTAAPGTPASSLHYGITINRKDGKTTDYTIEAAIPRAWVSGITTNETKGPAWRLNILRHRASDLASMSWSGPVVDDSDVAMMGLLIGE